MTNEEEQNNAIITARQTIDNLLEKTINNLKEPI